ncbi:substrate-binding periplasmic protein [Leptothrix discophora]|uniref:Transporter substrate-binding domain-containing protein n=1 Tax=Leptothrix discophora TaxID=89 RepID=A0ABT9G4R0_LEPDI|nr:transporter substrate-binding domain-containing protein [Leptothrix discophora]MDP4301475.1 transporter substrate-binding domain-containing protein [Leptothrix discophora]
MRCSLLPAGLIRAAVTALMLLAGLLPVRTAAAPAAASAVSAASAAASPCTRVVFSANPDYPPYHWAEGDRLVGASVALTGRILDDLGVAWEARHVGPWPRVLKSAEHGQIDLIVSLKPTPEREAYLVFTRAPAFPNPMAVFAAKARPVRFDSPQDLVGKRGGRTAGDRFGDAFDRYAEQALTLEDADSLSVNFNKLAAGRIDYVVTGLYTGRAQLLRLGLNDRIVPLPRPVNEGDVHHGFSRASPCAALVDAVNTRLAAARRDGLQGRLLEEALQQWQRSPANGQRP